MRGPVNIRIDQEVVIDVPKIKVIDGMDPLVLIQASLMAPTPNIAIYFLYFFSIGINNKVKWAIFGLQPKKRQSHPPFSIALP